MTSIRLLLFGMVWMMVIDAETVVTSKTPLIATTPPTATMNTKIAKHQKHQNTTKSAIEDCSECDIRVRETCMAMKGGQRECPLKIGALGRHYRCKYGARQGGKLCKGTCHNCAYGTDYCDEKGECVTQDNEMIRSMRRCTQGYGGPDCSMPCNATCHNQCSWMESYNATTKKLDCDHDRFVCQEENKQFFYGDEKCKETCQQSNDPLKECQGLCLYVNQAKSYQCIDLWNTTKTNKIPTCPLSKYGENCEKACDKCGPDAVCNKETGDCQCRHDIAKCLLCPPERESEKSCSKECKIEFDWNISTKGVAGPEGYCEDGKILCQDVMKTDGCRRCTKGWTGDKCDQLYTELHDTVSPEDDVEQTSPVSNPGEKQVRTTKIEKESSVTWIVAAVLLFIVEAALCCIGGTVYMVIAAKRHMSKKKKNEKKLKTPDVNSSKTSTSTGNVTSSPTGSPQHGA